ncbi:MAG: glycosyltransferase family 4 protein [Candidatus Binatia bacterium]
MDHQPQREIAYIMKGYPRLSDVFINNEIYQLECMGLKIRIFSVIRPESVKSHAIVGRIKAVVTYLPSVTSLTGTNFLTWLAVNLPQFCRGHVQLFRLRPYAYLQTLLYCLNMSLKYRSGFWPAKKFLRDFLLAGHIALKVLEAGEISHLHGHFCHGSTTITMFVSQLSGIPFSFTAHAKDIYLPTLNPGNLLQTKIRKARFVVTCTIVNKEYLESLCPEIQSIYTVYHGLDTIRFSPAHYRGAGKKMPSILSVGRFVEKKGFPYLLQACHLLKQKGYAFQCRIIGEADEQTDLIRQLISELGLERTVSVEGPVTQEELASIYKESIIFALPCQIVENGDRDGIPNVLMEAMAMAVPVVSTNISGIPELVEHRSDGLLVPQKNANALAGAIEELLKNPDLRRRLGMAAHEKIRRSFDATKTTLLLKDLFLPYLRARSSAHSNGRVAAFESREKSGNPSLI